MRCDSDSGNTIYEHEKIAILKHPTNIEELFSNCDNAPFDKKTTGGTGSEDLLNGIYSFAECWENKTN